MVVNIAGQCFAPEDDNHVSVLINDPRGHNVSVSDMKRAVNCALVFDLNGALYVELTRDIAPGVELLLDYGDEYWEGTYTKSLDNRIFRDLCRSNRHEARLLVLNFKKIGNIFLRSGN